MYSFLTSYQVLNPLNPRIKTEGIIYSPSYSCIVFLLYLPQLVFPHEKSCRPYMLCLEILTNTKWKITLVFSKVKFKKADVLSHLPEEVVFCGMKFSKSNPIYERRESIMTFEETNTSPYIQSTSSLLVLTCIQCCICPHVTGNWADTCASRRLV